MTWSMSWLCALDTDCYDVLMQHAHRATFAPSLARIPYPRRFLQHLSEPRYRRQPANSELSRAYVRWRMRLPQGIRWRLKE